MPLTDCTFEARIADNAGIIQVKTLASRIHRMQKLTDDVSVIQLKLPEHSSRTRFIFVNPDHSRRILNLRSVSTTRIDLLASRRAKHRHPAFP